MGGRVGKPSMPQIQWTGDILKFTRFRGKKKKILSMFCNIFFVDDFLRCVFNYKDNTYTDWLTTK